MIPIRIIYAMPLFNLAELIGVWKQTKCGITTCIGVVKTDCTEEHVKNIDPNKRRNEVENFPLAVFFKSKKTAG